MSKTVPAFAAALGVGLLAGLLYRVTGVPTPAPPWWALCGLLGIIGGEIGVAALRRRLGHRRRRGNTTRASATADKGTAP